MGNKLWTKNFTIITLGTIVSMLGSSMSGFSISILVLDYTGSTMLYAIFSVVYFLPQILMPLISGPFLDKFSRRKMIYTLDFISASLYLGSFFLFRMGFFNYAILLIMTFTFGTISSIYNVAYESLYPNLISEGNYAKAYSVSSMIYPLATIMMPVAVILYDRYGIAPIFLINAASFFVAALFETQIKVEETHMKAHPEGYGFKTYFSDFKQGVRYIISEKGLLVITAYFCITMFCDASFNTLLLPYFKNTAGLADRLLGADLVTYLSTAFGGQFGSIPEMIYSFLGAFGVLGRLIGGAVQYRFKLPVDRKFSIAIFVYITICFLSGANLFLPLLGMILCQFFVGLLGVTSYNIRISATQSYIPDSHRARFNGTFSMITSLGTIAGQLLAGALSEWLIVATETSAFLQWIDPIRLVVVSFSLLNLVAALVVMLGNRKHVAPIYNRIV